MLRSLIRTVSIETVLMMGHNRSFKGEIWKIILKFFFLPLLIWSTGIFYFSLNFKLLVSQSNFSENRKFTLRYWKFEMIFDLEIYRDDCTKITHLFITLFISENLEKGFCGMHDILCVHCLTQISREIVSCLSAHCHRTLLIQKTQNNEHRTLGNIHQFTNFRKKILIGIPYNGGTTGLKWTKSFSF